MNKNNNFQIEISEKEGFSSKQQHTTPCENGCLCCTIATMITFCTFFCIELIIVIAVKNIIIEKEDEQLPLNDKDTWKHFTNLTIWLYCVEILITCMFLIIYLKMKLWKKWKDKPSNLCLYIMTLMLTWIMACIVTCIVYENQYNTGKISFTVVFGLLILFTFCGPIFIACCFIL